MQERAGTGRDRQPYHLLFQRADGSTFDIPGELERADARLLEPVEHDGATFDFAFATDADGVPRFVFRERPSDR
jgi:hypothetical protein